MRNQFFFLFLFLLCACRKPAPPVPVLKDPVYEKAVSFLESRNDSAYYYFNKVVSTSKDSLLNARAYNNMAVIQYGAGDYFGAQEMLTLSLRFLDDQNEKHFRCLSSDYNELGLTYMKLRDYAASLPLYDKAVEYATSESAKRIYLNNKALTYGRKGDYVRAIQLYRSILATGLKSRKEYARTLSNMAISSWRADPGFHAAPLLYEALAIRIKEKDTWGQNASYHELADYYMSSRPDSASFYAKALYRTARLLGSPDDRQEALRKLVLLSPPQTARSFFSEYEHLGDSLLAARNSARNQFALIRYDAEKNKLDKLELQKQNADKRYQIIRQQLILGITLLLVIAGGIISALWFRKRKERMQLEARNAVRENQLRISKKVHDVVANGLYRVMQEVQYQELEKELLVGRIDHLYQQSRDISYDAPKSAPDFGRQVTELLQSFATDQTRVLLVGHDEQTWEGISADKRAEIEPVLQELMVNMSKHSGAENVLIRFERQPSGIRITYTDDGRGMIPEAPKGNGLRNTGNRMRAIGGEIIFEPNGARGLRVRMSFPIA